MSQQRIAMSVLSNAIVAYDEMGGPFIIVRDHGQKKRSDRLEAVKFHILAAMTMTDLVKTSLDPQDLDMIMISPGDMQ